MLGTDCAKFGIRGFVAWTTHSQSYKELIGIFVSSKNRTQARAELEEASSCQPLLCVLITDLARKMIEETRWFAEDL